MTNLYKMSADELLDEFGIELRADKTVYDPVEDKVFRNVAAWKMYVDQQETSEYGNFDKYAREHGYDDYDY